MSSQDPTRKLTYEEYFQESAAGRQHGRTPVRASHSHSSEARPRSARSAGAAYREPPLSAARTVRSATARAERLGAGAQRGSSPTPARRTPHRRRAMDEATTAKRRIDNIIEGLTKGSKLTEEEQLRLFEDLEREVDRFPPGPRSRRASL